MKITIHHGYHGKDVTIDTLDVDREKYEPGCMILTISPFIGCPLRLEFAICKDGRILTRSWTWDGHANHYAHTVNPADDINPTPEMAKTLAGLFSGRIKVKGLKVPIGQTPFAICPIDLNAEETRLGNKIYLT